LKKSLAVVLAALAFTVLSSRASFADTAVEAAVLRTVVILEAIAQIASDQKMNCDGMGTSLNQLADSTATERAQLATVLATATPAERKALDAKYAARVHIAQQHLMDGMTACGSNPRVIAAMQKFGSLPK
jgi:ABC-type transporter MlaC component